MAFVYDQKEKSCRFWRISFIFRMLLKQYILQKKHCVTGDHKDFIHRFLSNLGERFLLISGKLKKSSKTKKMQRLINHEGLGSEWVSVDFSLPFAKTLSATFAPLRRASSNRCAYRCVISGD